MSAPHPRTVALVGCSAEKAPGRLEARALYRGQLFRLARAWAEERADGWAILSAFHGVLAPTDRVSAYDRHLRQLSASERLSWGLRCGRTLRERWPEGRTPGGLRLVILASRAYAEGIPHRWGDWRPEVVTPLAGLGIGEQLGWLRRELDHAGPQAELFGPGELGTHRRLRWAGSGQGTRRRFELLEGERSTGLQVQHCGHPTALRPWALVDEARSLFGSWAHLADAQRAGLELFTGASRPRNGGRDDDENATDAPGDAPGVQLHR